MNYHESNGDLPALGWFIPRVVAKRRSCPSGSKIPPLGAPRAPLNFYPIECLPRGMRSIFYWGLNLFNWGMIVRRTCGGFHWDLTTFIFFFTCQRSHSIQMPFVKSVDAAPFFHGIISIKSNQPGFSMVTFISTFPQPPLSSPTSTHWTMFDRS
jgi:hypothetical protein